MKSLFRRRGHAPAGSGLKIGFHEKTAACLNQDVRVKPNVKTPSGRSRGWSAVFPFSDSGRENRGNFRKTYGMGSSWLRQAGIKPTISEAFGEDPSTILLKKLNVRDPDAAEYSRARKRHCGFGYAQELIFNRSFPRKPFFELKGINVPFASPSAALPAFSPQESSVRL